VCSGGAREFTIRLDTGVDAGGASLGGGAMDPLWRAGVAAPTGAAFAKESVPPSWVSAPAARWINPYPGATVHGYAVDFVYGATFAIPLTAYDVTVIGRYAADDSAVVTLGSYSHASPVLAFDAWQPIEVSGLGPGAHTLAANVHNTATGVRVPTPTGLIIEAEVHGSCRPTGGEGVACASGTDFRIPLNTGVDSNGAPMTSGSLDTRWRVDGPFAVVTTPHPLWLVPTASAWIGSTTSGLSTTERFYEYWANFSVPPDSRDVRLVGRFAADDYALLTVSDGQDPTSLVRVVAETPYGWAFLDWTVFDVPIESVGFHLLYASVDDAGGASTGLVLEAEVVGTCGGILESSVPGETPDAIQMG
jgi:hypothetical protein